MYRVDVDKIGLISRVIEGKYDGAAYLTERDNYWKVAWRSYGGVSPDNGKEVAKAIFEVAEIADRMNFEGVKKAYNIWDVDDEDYIQQEEMLTEALKNKDYGRIIDWLVDRL